MAPRTVASYAAAQSRGRSTTAVPVSGSSKRASAGPPSVTSAGSMHVQHHHLVAAVAQEAERGERQVAVEQEVGDEDHEAAPAQLVHHAASAPARRRCPAPHGSRRRVVTSLAPVGQRAPAAA